MQGVTASLTLTPMPCSGWRPLCCVDTAACELHLPPQRRLMGSIVALLPPTCTQDVSWPAGHALCLLAWLPCVIVYARCRGGASLASPHMSAASGHDAQVCRLVGAIMCLIRWCGPGAVMVGAFSGPQDQPILHAAGLSTDLQWAYRGSGCLFGTAILAVACLGLVSLRHHKQSGRELAWTATCAGQSSHLARPNCHPLTQVSCLRTSPP